MTILSKRCKITKKYILVCGVPGNEKKFQPGGRKKCFFTYFSEDLALAISFTHPIIAYF